MAKRGLPDTVRMRHDHHYVEALTAPAGEPVGRMVPIAEVDPNPTQPRQSMGDLTELIASIHEKGIIEPLIVRMRSGRYQIVAGERRYQAAVQAGVAELPVVIRDVDDTEVIEIALVENLQRKDLTAFEESDALQTLGQRCGYTHEDLARRLGKSRTSITESMAIGKMPEEVKRICRLADITSKSLLLEIVRQPDPAKMMALAEAIARRAHVTRDEVRREAARPKRGRPRAFVYKYRHPQKAFRFRLSFGKSRVARSEIIEALEAVLDDLRSGRDLDA